MDFEWTALHAWIEQRAETWQESDNRDGLLRDEEVSATRLQFDANHKPPPTELMLSFLQASEQQRTAENERIRQAARERKARELAVVSERVANRDPDIGLLLAAEAFETSATPLTERTLLSLHDRFTDLEHIIHAHDHEIVGLALSANGTFMASCDKGFGSPNKLQFFKLGNLEDDLPFYTVSGSEEQFGDCAIVGDESLMVNFEDTAMCYEFARESRLQFPPVPYNWHIGLPHGHPATIPGIDQVQAFRSVQDQGFTSIGVAGYIGHVVSSKSVLIQHQ